MKFDAPKNANYAATVLRVPALVDLPGLDNLVGVPTLGHQALTQKGKSVGDLVVAFTAETQLSMDFCHHNNLFRDATANVNQDEKGYLESNRRIRALKLRGHRSDALLMPLESLAYTGINVNDLKEGDTFDTLNGHEVCRKYTIPVKQGSQPRSKVEKAFKRVTDKQFPMHLETDNYWRSKHLLRTGQEVVVTQKLHGSSGRWGVVPALRKKGLVERIVNRWFKTPDFQHELTAGSRKVIKDGNPRQNDFYGFDLWSWYAKKLEGILPTGYIVYGELVGWLPGTETPIQRGYTYGLPKGECDLYVYRIATVNEQGILADLPWNGVKEFCLARGLKWVPELARVGEWGGEDYDFDTALDLWYMDKRYADMQRDPLKRNPFTEDPLPLSDKKTVDEGVVLRQEGIVPTLLKAKSAKFLEYETKQLDSGEADLESIA